MAKWPKTDENLARKDAVRISQNRPFGCKIASPEKRFGSTG